MTASIALLAGFGIRRALPFDSNSVRRRGRWPSQLVSSLHAREVAGKERQQEDLAAKAKGLLTVIISIDKQQLTLYSDGVPIAHSRVSTGTPGHPTPTGVFSIIQKDRWHRSNLYGNAPMYLHAADHLVRRGDAPGHRAELSGVARLHPLARGFRQADVEHDQDRRARHHRAQRGHPGCDLPRERLFTIKREEAEPKFEAQAMSRTPPSALPVRRNRRSYSALHHLDARRPIASDAGKAGRPRARRHGLRDRDAARHHLAATRQAGEQRRRARSAAAQARPDRRVHQPQGRQGVRAQGLRAGVRVRRSPSKTRISRSAPTSSLRSRSRMTTRPCAGTWCRCRAAAPRRPRRRRRASGSSAASPWLRLRRRRRTRRRARSRQHSAGRARPDFRADVARRLAHHLRPGPWSGDRQRHGLHRADALILRISTAWHPHVRGADAQSCGYCVPARAGTVRVCRFRIRSESPAHQRCEPIRCRDRRRPAQLHSAAGAPPAPRPAGRRFPTGRPRAVPPRASGAAPAAGRAGARDLAAWPRSFREASAPRDRRRSAAAAAARAPRARHRPPPPDCRVRAASAAPSSARNGNG